ncbi:DUF551 domain-containing protein [Escherichia coli]|nr:DUF551 domain-containing protein [Escherichia coli]
MTTITKERIELFIKNPLENGLTRGEQMELARIALASLEAEPIAWADNDELPLDYLQGQKDGLEWAAQLAEANHPQTGDWLYDDPVELAKAIRKGPDMPEAAGNSPVIPDGWISCSERMPDNNHDVLFFDVWGYIRIGWFSADDRSWFTSDDGCCMEVTHWMPLPEPPQEVNRG